MPKLYHKKSRNGCSRCRQRRVKCDEQRPRCSACARHNVTCEYPPQPIDDRPSNYQPEDRPDDRPESLSVASQPTPTSLASGIGSSVEVDFSSPNRLDRGPWYPYTDPGSGSSQSLESSVIATTPLELRLFQYWLVHTSSSFSISHDYWRLRVPVIASEHRPVLDGILAVAALHLHRQTDVKTPIGAAHRNKEPAIDNALFMREATSGEMLGNAVHYLHCAIRGHRDAFQNANKDNIEAVYLSSVLVIMISAFLLSAVSSVEESVAPFDEAMWLRLAVGPRELVPVWKTFVDQNEGHPLAFTGALRDGPDLSDNEELFRVEHAKPFEVLMTWASEFEYLSPEDHEAYQNTVSYIGIILTMMMDGSEHPQATSRRLLAFPSRVPPRFATLALSQQPRALVILAHVFALMKILARHVPWWTGAAERHVPRMEAKLPPGWLPVMHWPLAILAWTEEGGQSAPVPPTKKQLS